MMPDCTIECERHPDCTICGMPKKPVGRSAPLVAANSYCDHDCPGYDVEPKPGHLWPGEMQRTLQDAQQEQE